jgi:hydroxymethylbilane synthase
MTSALRIGTRGSPLALAQTAETRSRLAAAHPALGPDGAIETVVIRTTGDRELDRPLAEIGGKGLFTKEIDEALLEGHVDLAVNSMKDVPTWLPDGLALPCMLERQDPRDGFLSQRAPNLAGLAEGAVVGTTSLRRRAQVLHRRPDLRVAHFRGNVDTRIRKLGEGQVDATLLAVAGLRRLALDDALTSIMEPEEMLPAVGQGAVGIACRAGDDRVLALLAPLNHVATLRRVTAERAMLEVLDGSCRTPIAALARAGEDGTLTMTGLVARPDGTQVITTERRGRAADARAIGIDAGRELRRRAGPGFLDTLA